MRHAYKQLPLTGAIRSMMPTFRRSDSFGRIEIPDAFGYYPEAATEHAEKKAATEHSENRGWLPYGQEYIVDPHGEVTGFRMPNMEPASAEKIKHDCDVWKTSFARDQRASFIQNHDHDCTATCIKYQKRNMQQSFLGELAKRLLGPACLSAASDSSVMWLYKKKQCLNTSSDVAKSS